MQLVNSRSRLITVAGVLEVDCNPCAISASFNLYVSVDISAVDAYYSFGTTFTMDMQFLFRLRSSKNTDGFTGGSVFNILPASSTSSSSDAAAAPSAPPPPARKAAPVVGSQRVTVQRCVRARAFVCARE